MYEFSHIFLHLICVFCQIFFLGKCSFYHFYFTLAIDAGEISFHFYLQIFLLLYLYITVMKAFFSDHSTESDFLRRVFSPAVYIQLCSSASSVYLLLPEQCEWIQWIFTVHNHVHLCTSMLTSIFLYLCSDILI